jgi:hypothetical protein
MEGVLKQFDGWHRTRVGYSIMGLVELAVAYALGSWAIDSGNLWVYFFAAVFFVGAAYNLVNLIRITFHKSHGKH